MSNILTKYQEDHNIPLWLMSLVIVLPTFFAFLATSATNVALPHIAGAFGSTNDEVKWVVTSYLIANAIFLPLTGWLERLLGRIRFLEIFIGIFTVGSIICASAPNLNTLILGRVIQGVGGGILMPLSQSIFLQEYPANRRGEAMALFISATMLSAIVGPTVGGLIVDYLQWRWIFLINIPVGIFSLLAIPMTIKDTAKQRKKEPVDFLGLTLLVFWLFSLQVVLDKGQQYGWFDCTWICWLFIFSVSCFILFVTWELESDTPIVNLRVFKNTNFLFGTIIATLCAGMISATFFLLPQFYQGLMGYTASSTGLTLSTRIITYFLLFFIGRLCQLYDTRFLVGLGLVFLATSLGLCSNLNLQIAQTDIILSNAFLGFASILIMVPISTMALGTLPNNEISNAAGIHSVSKCMGNSIVTSIASSLSISLAQVHQTYLLKNMTVYKTSFVNSLMSAKSMFLSSNAPSIAEHKAYALMYSKLTAQAQLCAYADIFQYAALISFLALPLVLLLKTKK